MESLFEVNQKILYERLKRQRLLEPIDSTNDKEYLDLFRLLQPVAPVHFSRPGDPPTLVHRTSPNDYKYANKLRRNQKLVKGRFQGGRIGYVYQEDLKLYATAFRKPIKTVKPIHEDIMELLNHSGGMSKDQLKEELDYPNGEITKALKTLHESFFVYEAQLDTDWDTGWFSFKTEWFDVPTDQEVVEDAIAMVISNFIKGMIIASMGQIKSWSQLSIKVLKNVLNRLVAEGKIVIYSKDDLETYYMGVEDASVQFVATPIPNSVFMLDKSDFLVRAHLSHLQGKYKGKEVLQYLLIDGKFQGAVIGHWRIGPYDIDDVIVELEDAQVEARKEEIITAIRKIYSPDTTDINAYNGVPIGGRYE